MQGTLYIVATPIGNLNDITFRAVQILKSVDIILVEDSRHSKTLFNHYDIRVKTSPVHEHNERQQTNKIIQMLIEGKNIALISDAGTPLISDPGYILVRETKKADMSVVPIPGASAITSALSAAGLASNNFSFLGFLPAKQQARLTTIGSIIYKKETTIFFESPKRIIDTMLDLLNMLGDNREVCVAREITKSFETIKLGTLPKLLTYLQTNSNHQRGEFVILISGAKKDTKNTAELDDILKILLTEMGASKAAKIAAKIVGIDKKHCYKRALEL